MIITILDENLKELNNYLEQVQNTETQNKNWKKAYILEKKKAGFKCEAYTNEHKVAFICNGCNKENLLKEFAKFITGFKTNTNLNQTSKIGESSNNESDFFCGCTQNPSQEIVYIAGYTRSDGKKVKGYYRAKFV